MAAASQSKGDTDGNAASKAKAAGKAQVAKDYIVQLRSALPVGTFRSVRPRSGPLTIPDAS